MSASMGGVELLSIIRSSLDASGYVAGARQVEGANERLRASGDKVAGSQERITRGMDQTARQGAALAQRTNPAVKATGEQAIVVRFGMPDVSGHGKAHRLLVERFRGGGPAHGAGPLPGSPERLVRRGDREGASGEERQHDGALPDPQL